MMTEQDIINFKLSLAKAWIDNGQEDLAKSIIKTIIERAEGQNE
jgi:Tfp pilus assembly protein FimV